MLSWMGWFLPHLVLLVRRGRGVTSLRCTLRVPVCCLLGSISAFVSFSIFGISIILMSPSPSLMSDPLELIGILFSMVRNFLMNFEEVERSSFRNY